MSETKTSKVSQDDKLWGALGYLWIVSIIALAIKKNRPYVRHHASQGTMLFVIWVVFLFPLFWFLTPLVNLILIIVSIFGIIKSLQGDKWEMPLLGGPSRKLADWIVKTLKI